MVGPEAVGRTSKPCRVRADAGRLRFFAKATGEDRDVYRSTEAARAAGYPDIPAPPTYAFCLAMLDEDEPMGWMSEIGIDLTRVLHAEQEFTYHQPICAGDDLVLTRRIVDVQERKGGALTFVVADSEGRGPDGALKVVMRMTIAVRNT